MGFQGVLLIFHLFRPIDSALFLLNAGQKREGAKINTRGRKKKGVRVLKKGEGAKKIGGGTEKKGGYSFGELNTHLTCKKIVVIFEIFSHFS